MEKKIKLIWDFRGAGAVQTAAHHEIHLKEFIEAEKLEVILTGVEEFNEFYAMAYMVVLQHDMISIRDVLKPHRGEWYEG